MVCCFAKTPSMKLDIITSTAFVLLLGAAAPPTAVRPEIVTGDVDRFFAVYDTAKGEPTAEQLQRDYLEKASNGLDKFARIRRITAESMAAANAKRPEIYVHARGLLAALQGVKSRITSPLSILVS